MLRLAARRALSSLPHAPIIRQRHTSTVAAARVLPTSTLPGRYPTRGGQNLTDRFRRLEKSARGKGTYQSDIAELSREIQDNGPKAGLRVRPAKREVKTFMGFTIPGEPKPPEPDECCMSGCAFCVQDLYMEALDEYKKAVDSVRFSLRTLHIPEERWPSEIQTSAAKKLEPKKNPVYDAFAELERKLQEKHRAESHDGG
ncbi:uncharacterized protein PHACADRAFT_118429 [Phanerochaete carnosa HHB-10118-sp]|uniref:Oxidoreductase-like domain-containing protein n=1 Tax=Phanerochaete carnosa (strain HHB-10118-sp) TaxID=650164 RepID=K5WC77_PHACS|nr:uncharacterized protein PHACADRAFT_118429 [Phanerochaete carnosa HHB-10118-sp]EKM56609.1 hypothetical protein PHACADRAFT_118429 [Phanerochaete carnosa HHB-10118-sp]